uniref:Large ribosomal subunit protein uL4c n=1 Tax=Campylaephora sungminbooi TaxID=1896769 RepID=A0A1B0TI73_9FLOR|nr:50S ribosomal protein L4 [Campylaephora sungminbooi]AKU47422.1 50S ribosomal protein L4 [Campylaephora sungminbooi]ALN11869.1 50S ribosomal protein L4 [Campylaephora sungminbooi]
MKTIKKITYSIIDQLDETYSNSINLYLQINNNHNIRMYIVHRAIKEQLNNKRYGNAHTKTRSKVRGGGKKPWKQKGTGRARAGSTRSPLWRGGGVIFGPKTKKYNNKINRKEKQLAVKTLLYNKYQYTTVVNNLFINIDKPNTKVLLNTLQQLGFCLNKQEKFLIIVHKKTQNLYLSVRNISNIEIIEAINLNSLSIIKADKIILTNEALNTINKLYNDENT